MTEREQRRRDADTLIESMRHDWRDLAEKNLARAEREGIHTHIQWCMEELTGLLDQARKADA